MSSKTSTEGLDNVDNDKKNISDLTKRTKKRTSDIYEERDPGLVEISHEDACDEEEENMNSNPTRDKKFELNESGSRMGESAVNYRNVDFELEILNHFRANLRESLNVKPGKNSKAPPTANAEKIDTSIVPDARDNMQPQYQSENEYFPEADFIDIDGTKKNIK